MRLSNAVGYLSAQSDSHNLQRKTFKTFNVGMNTKRRKIANKAKKISKLIIDGWPFHSLFIGKTETGKTYLAYSVVNDVFKQTSYRKNVVFLDMLKLSILQKKAINDISTRKWFNSLLSQINKADLVVLDDLGRKSTNLLTDGTKLSSLIAGDRVNKPLLITSNLENGLGRYSQQIQDRLIPNEKYSIAFYGLSSYHPKVSEKVTD